MADIGKFKNQVVVTETVTMSASAQPRNEFQIPAYGDIAGVMVNIAQSTTGTLSSALTLDYAISSLTVKDKSGKQLMQSIRGRDLLFLERYRMKGRSRTVPTTSGSTQYENFYIPLNIEKSRQEAKIQLTVAPYSDMASSGATGGTLTYTLVVYYYDQTEKNVTEKIQRITKTVNAGANSYGSDLPKNIVIQNLLFKIGTESYITTIRFTGDGNKELDSVTVAQLTALDNSLLISGHVSAEFSLYNAPFLCTAATALDLVASTGDTLELFIVSNE